MNNITVNEVALMLKESESVTILCHSNPDEDTLGSAYALYLSLFSLGKSVHILCPIQPSERAEKYIDYSLIEYTPTVYENSLVISVDVASLAMLGTFADVYQGKVDIRLDHHAISSEFAKYNLNIPENTACAVLVYEVIKNLSAITERMASALYTALSSDSGGFRYGNTNSASLRIAAELIDFGADAKGISEALFEIKTPESMRAIRLGLDNIRYICGGKVALISITNADKRREGITDVNLDEVSVISNQTKGVLLGIVLKQCDGESNKYRVSMRSRYPVDASEICRNLGGGGHECAAGATIFASNIVEAEEVLLSNVYASIANISI